MPGTHQQLQKHIRNIRNVPETLQPAITNPGQVRKAPEMSETHKTSTRSKQNDPGVLAARQELSRRTQDEAATHQRCQGRISNSRSTPGTSGMHQKRQGRTRDTLSSSIHIRRSLRRVRPKQKGWGCHQLIRETKAACDEQQERREPTSTMSNSQGGKVK